MNKSRNQREGYYWGLEKMYESHNEYRHDWKLVYKGHWRGDREASLKSCIKNRKKLT